LVIKDPEANNKRYGEVSFQFDKVFWTNAKQEDVFDISCRAQVDHVMNGYNSCCFAYGQTGSGKTYTMFGEGGEVRGVIPRSVEYLFQCLAKKTSTSEVAMVCSFLEIYNDQIRDLGKAYLAAMGVESNTSAALHEKTSDLFEKLAGKRGNPYFAPAFHKSGSAMALSGAVRPGLKEVQDEYNTMNYEIREDNEGNVFVKDLSLVPVTTMEEVMSLIATGLRVRATHETKMNAFSSRSHTVFTITVLQRDKITGEAITGMLNLVDLAGSERLKKSESIGVRLKEALHINTSLTALGKVIMALDPSSENSHIPYRDSKLTRVLQNSLGGNSFTTVIATVHPVAKFYEECLSSLQFANRCRNVRNNPRVNYVEDSEDKDRKIRKLMEEIGTLRTKMTQLTGNDLAGGMRASVAGGAGGGAGKLSPAALVQLLKRLGIAATLAPDGALLVNGQKFGADDIGLGEGSTDYGGGGGGKDGSGNNVNTEKLLKSIKELKETNANYSAKSKDRKLQMEEQGRQLQKMSMEIVKLQTGMRHKEFECKSLAEEKERALSEMKQFLENKYAQDLQGMISHNRELLSHHQEEFNKIPTALMEYTKLNAKNEKERNEFEAPLRAEFEVTLKGLDKSRLAELAHVKAQYDFWLEEKDMALSGFVDSFNAYRVKKSEQLRMAEREIVKLYDYFEQLEAVLQGACDGKFLVRIKEAGFAIPESRFGSTDMDNVEGGVKGAVIIPKAFVPLNPFKIKGEARLDLTLKIVEKHKERTERLRKMKTDALEKSVHYAQKSAKKNLESGSLVGNVRNFLATRPITPPEKLQVVSGITYHAPTSVPRPLSAGALAVQALPTSVPKLPPARSSATAPASKLNASGSLNRSRDLTVQRSPSRMVPGSQLDVKYRGPDLVSTAPGELQSRSRLDPEQWPEEDSERAPSSHNRSSKALLLEKQNRELAAEVQRLQERERKSKAQAVEMGTPQTAEHIRKLEAESERLKKLVKDINAQLHASKVAQNALTRKFGRGYDSNEENDGVF